MVYISYPGSSKTQPCRIAENNLNINEGLEQLYKVALTLFKLSGFLKFDAFILADGII